MGSLGANEAKTGKKFCRGGSERMETYPFDESFVVFEELTLFELVFSLFHGV